MRIVVGTYSGILYGWEGHQVNRENEEEKTEIQLKLKFGYAAHPSCIKSAALMKAKNGRILMSGGADEITKIYNVDKRVEIGSLMQHSGSITCIQYFGQTHVLTGSSDCTICIWRVGDWNLLHILGGHKGAINSIAVHPSGKMALSVSKDRTLRMWNLVKGRCAYIRRLESESSHVFLSDCGTKYGLIFDKEVCIFGINDGLIHGKLIHKQRVQTAVFLTDDIIVCGGDDKKIYLWKCDGNLIHSLENTKIQSRIRQIDLIPRPQPFCPHIVSATTNGSVMIWDVEDLIKKNSSSKKESIAYEPIASCRINGDDRITCLTTCVTDFKDPDHVFTEQEKTDAEEEINPTLSIETKIHRKKEIQQMDSTHAKIVIETENSTRGNAKKRKNQENWKKFKSKKKIQENMCKNDKTKKNTPNQ